jgi:hypothetical protein
MNPHVPQTVPLLAPEEGIILQEVSKFIMKMAENG